MNNNGMTDGGGMSGGGMSGGGMSGGGMSGGGSSTNKKPETIYYCAETVDGDYVFKEGKCMTDDTGNTIGEPVIICRSYMYDDNNNEVLNDEAGACPEPFTNLKSSKKYKQRKSEEHFESNKNLKCKHKY